MKNFSDFLNEVLAQGENSKSVNEDFQTLESSEGGKFIVAGSAPGAPEVLNNIDEENNMAYAIIYLGGKAPGEHNKNGNLAKLIRDTDSLNVSYTPGDAYTAKIAAALDELEFGTVVYFHFGAGGKINPALVRGQAQHPLFPEGGINGDEEYYAWGPSASARSAAALKALDLAYDDGLANLIPAYPDAENGSGWVVNFGDEENVFGDSMELAEYVRSMIVDGMDILAEEDDNLWADVTFAFVMKVELE